MYLCTFGHVEQRLAVFSPVFYLVFLVVSFFVSGFEYARRDMQISSGLGVGVKSFLFLLLLCVCVDF